MQFIFRQQYGRVTSCLPRPTRAVQAVPWGPPGRELLDGAGATATCRGGRLTVSSFIKKTLIFSLTQQFLKKALCDP